MGAGGGSGNVDVDDERKPKIPASHCSFLFWSHRRNSHHQTKGGESSVKIDGERGEIGFPLIDRFQLSGSADSRDDS